MDNLISVNMDTETVSARDLYDALEIGTEFNHWFPRMTEYGFTEGTDFSPKMTESTGGRPSTDYDISVDMAKQICMIQRSDKGKQLRQYFIDLEKAWNTPELIMARALKIAEHTQQELRNRIEQMRPKEIFADAVCTSKSSILIGDLAKLICQNGYSIGQKRLFNWLRDNGYLIKSGESRNMPTQLSMGMNLMEVKESNIQCPDGSVRITRTTKITGKGQVYFVNKFLKGKESNEEEVAYYL